MDVNSAELHLTMGAMVPSVLRVSYRLNHSGVPGGLLSGRFVLTGREPLWAGPPLLAVPVPNPPECPGAVLTAQGRRVGPRTQRLAPARAGSVLIGPLLTTRGQRSGRREGTRAGLWCGLQGLARLRVWRFRGASVRAPSTCSLEAMLTRFEEEAEAEPLWKLEPTSVFCLY